MIEETTYPLIELMEKAVIVSAFMLVLAIVYVYIIEPLLKAKCSIRFFFFEQHDSHLIRIILQ